MNPALRTAIEKQAEFASSYKKEDLEILLKVLSPEERRIFDEHLAFLNRVETTPEGITHRSVAFLLREFGGLTEDELERYSPKLPKCPWKKKFRNRLHGFRRKFPKASLPRAPHSD